VGERESGAVSALTGGIWGQLNSCDIIGPARGLKLPVADEARMFSLAACSVGVALTFAARALSHSEVVNGGHKEKSMEIKTVGSMMVRSSFFGVIADIGTAAIGGILAT